MEIGTILQPEAEQPTLVAEAITGVVSSNSLSIFKQENTTV